RAESRAQNLTAVILDGRLVASEIKKQVALQVGQLAKRGIRPFLATIQVGDDPASSSYLRGKHKAAEEVGIHSENYHLPANTPKDKVEALLGQLNTNPRVHEILVQLPLRHDFDEDRIIERILTYKDVNGSQPI